MKFTGEVQFVANEHRITKQKKRLEKGHEGSEMKRESHLGKGLGWNTLNYSNACLNSTGHN